MVPSVSQRSQLHANIYIKHLYKSIKLYIEMYMHRSICIYVFLGFTCLYIYIHM